MARKFTDLARQARERYNQQTDGDQEMAQDTMNVAPPMAKKQNIYVTQTVTYTRGFLN